MANQRGDMNRIKKLVEVMNDNDLVEIEIVHGDDKIHLKRSGAVAGGMPMMPMANAGMPAGMSGASEGGTEHEDEKGDENLIEITSPIVGTFYATPSPDADPYVQVGSRVNPKTVVCIVEAMKVMNEIKAETSGTIVEVCHESGQAVE